MTTPKEALEGLIEAVTRDANEPGGRGISGYTSARLSDAKSALTSLQGEDAVERVARIIIGPRLPVPDNCQFTLEELRSVRWSQSTKAEQQDALSAARAILATGLVPDEAAVNQSALWVISYTNYRGETSVRRIIPKSVRYGSTEWHPEPQWLLLAWDDDKQADREFALKDFGSPEAAVRADEREKQRKRDAEIAHSYFESFGPKEKWPLEKMQAGFDIASAISGGDLERRARPPLKPDEVEWVVNDIAELGVKIGNQFFFLYKGSSLVYGTDDISSAGGFALNEDTDPPTIHKWRPVFKREFGECCHPVNRIDPTRIGTVSLDDSDDWKPLPAAIRSGGGE